MTRFHQLPGRLCSRSPVALLLGLLILLFAGSALAAEPGERPVPAPPPGGLDPDNLPPEMGQSLEQLLNDPEGVAPDRQEARCVNRRVASRTEILDSEHILFRSTVGGKAWLNRLSPGCIGMREDMTLVMDGRGANMCALDQVYGISRSSTVAIPSGRCSLGKFEPITRQHADALRDSFKLRGKQMADARRAERSKKREQRRKERKERRAARRAAREAADAA